MKIEILKGGEAIVTKGSRQAKVYRTASDWWKLWRYEANGEYVSLWMDMRLEVAYARYVRSKRVDPWQPVAKLPEARINLTSDRK